jgi:hypothetical protein
MSKDEQRAPVEEMEAIYRRLAALRHCSLESEAI